jgi:hypothetical protein
LRSSCPNESGRERRSAECAPLFRPTALSADIARALRLLLIEGRNYSPAQFIEQIKMDFDQLYEEAGHRRRMMSVSAHDRISGSPQMVRAWDEFLRYAKGRPGVAFLRKDEIARYALESRLTLQESETI